MTDIAIRGEGIAHLHQLHLLAFHTKMNGTLTD